MDSIRTSFKRIVFLILVILLLNQNSAAQNQVSSDLIDYPRYQFAQLLAEYEKHRMILEKNEQQPNTEVFIPGSLTDFSSELVENILQKAMHTPSLIEPEYIFYKQYPSIPDLVGLQTSNLLSTLAAPSNLQTFLKDLVYPLHSGLHIQLKKLNSLNSREAKASILQLIVRDIQKSLPAAFYAIVSAQRSNYRTLCLSGCISDDLECKQKCFEDVPKSCLNVCLPQLHESCLSACSSPSLFDRLSPRKFMEQNAYAGFLDESWLESILNLKKPTAIFRSLIYLNTNQLLMKRQYDQELKLIQANLAGLVASQIRCSRFLKDYQNRRSEMLHDRSQVIQNMETAPAFSEITEK